MGGGEGEGVKTMKGDIVSLIHRNTFLNELGKCSDVTVMFRCHGGAESEHFPSSFIQPALLKTAH